MRTSPRPSQAFPSAESAASAQVQPDERLARLVLRGQEKALQCQRLRIARRELKTSVQRGQCRFRVAESEFQFGHALPGEAEFRRNRGGLPGQAKRILQRGFADGPRLLKVRAGEAFGGEPGLARGNARLKLHRRDELAQRVGELLGTAALVGYPGQGRLGFVHFADRKQQCRNIDPLAVGNVAAAGRILLQRGQEVP